MASLSRKFLTTLGIEEDKADQIFERHTEVLTEIKEERDKFKTEAEQLPELQKQVEKLQADAAKSEKDPYKVKYDALKEEFDTFKKDIEAKETTAKKESAYRQLLKDCGVSEKRIDAIIKVSDIESIELDDEGKTKDGDKLAESIKTEWADFIQTEGKQGAETATPPKTATGGTDLGKLSMAEYIKARKSN